MGATITDGQVSYLYHNMQSVEVVYGFNWHASAAIFAFAADGPICGAGYH